MFQETDRNGLEMFLIIGYGLETFQWHFQAVSPLFQFSKRGTVFPLPFLEVSGNLAHFFNHLKSKEHTNPLLQKRILYFSLSLFACSSLV